MPSAWHKAGKCRIDNRHQMISSVSLIENQTLGKQALYESVVRSGKVPSSGTCGPLSNLCRCSKEVQSGDSGWSQPAGVHVLALPFSTCVFLDKSLNLRLFISEIGQ